MAQTPEQTRHEIEESRVRLSSAVDELEHRMQDTRDWKSWVNRYPLESVAVVFSVGLLVGRALFSRKQDPNPQETPRRSSLGIMFRLAQPAITPLITAQIVKRVRSKPPKEEAA